MLRVAVLFCIIAVAAATKYCCVPTQWEGFHGIIGGIVPQSQPEVDLGRVALSYDATNKRTASTANVTVSGQPTAMKYIQVGGMIYIINLLTMKCNKQEMAFKPFCVPDDATDMGAYYQGKGGNVLEGHNYFYNYNNQQQGTALAVFLAVTPDRCVPLSTIYYGSMNKVPTIQAFGFINITSGIKDPSVFKVPAICNTEDTPKDEVLHVEQVARLLGFFVI